VTADVNDLYTQMVQPAAPSPTSEAHVAGPRPIRTVIVPSPEPSEPPPLMPYRTRVEYRADDEQQGAPADHVTTQPRSRDTARLAAAATSQQHAVNVTSSGVRDAPTRIQIGDHLDTDKPRLTEFLPRDAMCIVLA